MKTQCLLVSDKIVENCIFKKPILWPCELLMQPITTIWTLLVEGHPGTIPVEYGQIPINGSI